MTSSEAPILWSKAPRHHRTAKPWFVLSMLFVLVARRRLSAFYRVGNSRKERLFGIVLAPLRARPTEQTPTNESDSKTA